MLRAAMAHTLWWVCATCALGLALAVLLVALRAPAGNALVMLLFETAQRLSFGLGEGVVELLARVGRAPSQSRAWVGDALGWSVAAAAWLVVGAVAQALLKPRGGTRASR